MDILEKHIGGKGVAYYINLAERLDRKVSAENNCKQAGFPNAQRYPATNWKNINTNDIDIDVDDDLDLLAANKYTVSLSISNVNLLNDFLNSDYDFVIIFEDDVFFDLEFQDRLKEKIKSVPSDWDIITLGCAPFLLGPIQKDPELVEGESVEDPYRIEKYYNLGNGHATLIKNKKVAQYILSRATPYKYPWDAFIGSLADTLNIYNINKLMYQDNFITDIQHNNFNYYTLWAHILVVKILAAYASNYNNDLIKSTQIAYEFINNDIDDIIAQGNDLAYDKNFKNKLLLDNQLTILLVTLRDYLQTRLSYNLLESQNLALYLINNFFDKYIENYNLILPKLQEQNVITMRDMVQKFDLNSINILDYYKKNEKYAKFISEKKSLFVDDDTIWNIYKITGSLVHL